MRWLPNLHLAETSKAQKMYLSSRRLTRLKSDGNVWQDFNSDDIYGSEVKYWQLTAVKRHCTNWYEIWSLTDHEINYIKFELDLRQTSNGLLSETEKGFGVGPTSLKKTTLSGCKWCLEMSGKRSNHASMHNFQLGKVKFTLLTKEVTLPATFVTL